MTEAGGRIAGQVILKESGIGIPDLLVVLFDVDPDDGVDLVATGHGGEPRPHGDRIGSVRTSTGRGEDEQAGAFELDYTRDDIGSASQQESRPDLLLMVLAPEEHAEEPDARVLFVSAVREDAGRNEEWVVRLATAQLEAAGVPLPTVPADEVVEDAERVVTRLLNADVRRETMDEGMRAIDRKKVERVRETAGSFRGTLQPALRKALSRVPDNVLDPDAFVGPGDSVEVKSNGIIRRGIEQVVNSDDVRVRPPIKGFVALTDEQRQTLEGLLGDDGTVSAEALTEVLTGGEQAPRPATFVVREDPTEEICRPQSSEEAECLGDLIDDGGVDLIPPQNPPGDRPGSGVTAVGGDDIPRFVARLIDTMTSPEEEVVSGLEPRSDAGRVEEHVRSLAFPPSPADTPAFYDFHNVQIAFEHVWQEAIDEGVLDLAEDAYEDIVELGGDPDREDGDALDPVGAIFNEGRFVLTARREVRDHRGRTVVRDHRTGVTVRDHRGETVVRDHRTDVREHRPDVRDHRTRRPGERLPELLAELERRLKEEYAFTVYAANRKERSINFGLLVTYRQRWEPLAYQAGKLLKTLTLAPKETQRYSRKTVVRRKRAEREVEQRSQIRRDEASQTSRAEHEIVRKAMAKTNFSLVTEGSFNVEVAEGTATTTFSREAVKSSDDVKKAFHEAVFKSAQEYKDEHTTEVNAEQVEELEVTESGEVSNPNDELAVTFLFYELQRRYRVTERIHRVIPIVFVAQEVPRPDEIDEAWLIAHDWILRRSLLDASFAKALDLLAHGIVGEEVALEQFRRNVDQQRRIVDELRRELTAVRERETFQRSLVERALFQRANVVRDRSGEDDGGGGIFGGIPVVGEVVEEVADVVEGVGEVAVGAVREGAGALGEFIFGGEGDAAQSRQDALNEMLQRTADEARDLLHRLEREVTALNAITEKYTAALAEYFNHRAEIARLRTHVRQNILAYMQAIWTYEPSDQRFFRLHNVPVPVLEPTTRTFRFDDLEPVRSSLAAVAHRTVELNGRPPTQLYAYEANFKLDPEFPVKPLVQVADLDTLLGFKGNYMVFALRESNALTDYMLEPYVVTGLEELIDPDDLGNFTIEEFARYVCCLREKLTDEQFEAIREQLLEQYRRLLTASRPNGDIITTPTTSLFIEAMVAEDSVIERYKALHRKIDVKKVQADVREQELENVRLAARLLEGERDDPDVERKIVIEGDTPSIVVPADAS